MPRLGLLAASPSLLLNGTTSLSVEEGDQLYGAGVLRGRRARPQDEDDDDRCRRDADGDRAAGLPLPPPLPRFLTSLRSLNFFVFHLNTA